MATGASVSPSEIRRRQPFLLVVGLVVSTPKAKITPKMST